MCIWYAPQFIPWVGVQQPRNRTWVSRFAVWCFTTKLLLQCLKISHGQNTTRFDLLNAAMLALRGCCSEHALLQKHRSRSCHIVRCCSVSTQQQLDAITRRQALLGGASLAGACLHAPAAPAKDILSPIPQAHLEDGLKVSKARTCGQMEFRCSCLSNHLIPCYTY